MNWSRLDKSPWVLFPVFIFAVLTVATLVENRPLSFSFDDSFITIANAELLVRGGADSFGNTVATGATSPVHMFLVALFTFFMPAPVASFVLLFIMATCYAVGLWKLLRVVGGGPFLSACGTVIGLVAAMAWIQLMNGLETGLAMAVIVWAVYCSQVRRDVPLAILVGLMPFVRPEFAVLSLLLALFSAWRLRREHIHLLKLASVAIFVAAVLGVLSWYFTGHVISPTAEAKSAYFDEDPVKFKDRLIMAFSALRSTAIVWPLAGLVMLPIVRDGWVYLGFVIAFVVAAAISLPSAMFGYEYRYLYPFLPLGIVGWTAVAIHFRQIQPMIALAALCYIIAFPSSGWRYYRGSTDWNRAQEDVALWAEANLPDDARILIHDAGYFAWHAQFVVEQPKGFVLIDGVGLKTPSVIKYHEEITGPSRGRDRGKAIDLIAREGQAQYAIILDWPFWRDYEAYLRGAGWTVDLIYPNPGRYQIFRIAPPLPG
ncbi:MAG TPA: hypothetical protein VGC40_00125 [Paenirhodobacter sp.]